MFGKLGCSFGHARLLDKESVDLRDRWQLAAKIKVATASERIGEILGGSNSGYGLIQLLRSYVRCRRTPKQAMANSILF